MAGMRFMPGEALFRIANLGTVWMIGDVFEQDLALVKRGAKATLRVDAYPDRAFPGQVTFIYPTLNTETRTARVRVELANADGMLKPGMYGTVQIGGGSARDVLVVPDSAVIDSGARQTVLIALGEGRFEPREVKLGARGGGVVEVLSGVKDGESVVTRANFLIDAESNLKAALGGMNASANTGGIGHAGDRRPRRRRREVRSNDDHARSGAVAQVAEDDDGVRAGQRRDRPDRQAGQPDPLRVRRAQARRVGRHEDRTRLRRHVQAGRAEVRRAQALRRT